MYRKKTKVIMIMVIVIAFMAVGYALLSTSLNINGSTAVTSNWQVEFSDIRTVEQKGGATNKIIPTVSKTTANFEVDLVQPGDEITYEIDITNYGDIEAEVKGATYTGSGSEAIYVRFEGIRKGTRITSCEGQSTCPKVTVIVKVGYDASVTSDPEEKTKDISITLDIGQYVSSNPTPDGELLPELTIYTLPEKILNDNKIQSDSNIDFSKTSQQDGTKGLYYTSTNTERGQTVYYFRGAVENNYVYFAGFYWRIVRINEDRSVRLIYQGESIDATGSDATIGSSAFNSHSNDNAYVGYMYGTPGSDTYEETHTNANDSTIKQVIDTWYKENLSSYASYLADAGFCGDRSMTSQPGIYDTWDTSLGYGDENTMYQPRIRLYVNKSPIFKCINNNDLYTTSSSAKGNKALDYPISLITADEVAFAGNVWTVANETNYLNAGIKYWLMSPFSNGANVYIYSYSENAEIRNDTNIESYGIRPVINLQTSILVSNGEGTKDAPYTIKVD